MSKCNFYERIVDELLNGPQTVQRLKQRVGVSIHARIHEFNKVHGNVLEILVKDGVARLVRHARIKVDHKKAYPEYYDENGYIYSLSRRSHKK